MLYFVLIDGPEAKFKDIFIMYSAMKRGARYLDICLSYNPNKLNIDERNLVIYGLSNGYIRQLRKVRNDSDYSIQICKMKNAYHWNFVIV